MPTKQEWIDQSWEECKPDLNKQIACLAEQCEFLEQVLVRNSGSSMIMIQAGMDLLLNPPGSDEYSRAAKLFQDLSSQINAETVKRFGKEMFE